MSWLQRSGHLLVRQGICRGNSSISNSAGVQRIIGSGCCSQYSSSTRVQQEWHGTTILCVRKNGEICMIGDGQVTAGAVVVKPNAKKVRRIEPKKKTSSMSCSEEVETEGTVVGFAGSTADAFTLLERLEGKLEEYGPGQLTRSCVELAKGWRTDKYLRRLEASLLVADHTGVALEITGNGDVLESHDGVLAVGSGGHYAMAAARALQTIPDLSAQQVAQQSMQIAADMCVYTNTSFRMETLTIVEETKQENSNTSSS
eukprot:CAMPEP_0197824706 /NCGR_PEP_ID=MMETSP1437-20131217/1930_1 /TAXON_ID=49252 ORGANISM="Eucampia antarctica, Strain CCMP1452" /NCGR_SAMPLE_ID=MMETSP1437 /ASSEMBLY_ACC=CAM_ASM_001096 /LENGTH=257 /DNA_ID=CAMNT_0043424443 /DNA_START=45 /DNA_END=818 /DNA_ORIENTATION=-